MERKPLSPILLYRTISTYNKTSNDIKQIISEKNGNLTGEENAIIWYIGINYITYIWLSPESLLGYKIKTIYNNKKENVNNFEIYKPLECMKKYILVK